jgi:preprotein translocase subunit SecG
MNILIGLLTAIHIIVAVFLIVLVLMQKSHEQGVGAAFGGGMTDTVFGGGTTTALVRMTIWCACILLATTLVLAVLHSHRGRSTAGTSIMQRTLATMPAAPASQPGSSVPLEPSGPATTSATPAGQPAAPTASPPPANDTAGTTTPATSTTPQPEASK